MTVALHQIFRPYERTPCACNIYILKSSLLLYYKYYKLCVQKIEYFSHFVGKNLISNNNKKLELLRYTNNSHLYAWIIIMECFERNFFAKFFNANMCRWSVNQFNPLLKGQAAHNNFST